MSENTFEQVRERAYAIWAREGKPEGRELEHWFRAEQELAQQLPNDSQIDAMEITEEREHLREMEEATGHEIANQPPRKKKIASQQP
ncbi:MAG TPA: DUF2934 domain-containing protein [Candidatus Binataceae bacterium]|nr:DUF2934 domain-containing protein [Candidatus Binataceae bacterium]